MVVPAVGFGAAHLEHLNDFIAGDAIGPNAVAWGAMLLTIGIKRLTVDRYLEARKNRQSEVPLADEIRRNLETLKLPELELSVRQELALSDLVADFERAKGREELEGVLGRSRSLRDDILGD